MLSGVGKAKALRSLGIDLVENLPGVGQNLQDHVLLSGVVFKYKGKMPDRPADSNAVEAEDRKSTRLNSSHGYISYAVFCLKKKKNKREQQYTRHSRQLLEASSN